MSNWIEGRLPMMREPVQVETPEGVRAIISCPSCGGARGLNVVRWRPVSKDISRATVARSDSPYGRPGNKEGERLKSKCCEKDILALQQPSSLNDFRCSYCLEACEVKE